VLERECYFVINNPGYDDSDFKITLAAGYYGTFEELSVGLHDAQVLRITYVTSSDRVPIWFSFDMERNRVKMTVSQSLCISLSPVLARMLGFPRDIEHCLDDVLANRKMELFPPTIDSVYVYCDLVKDVPVGDTKAQLLRIVNRMSERCVHETFIPPLYITLQKKCFHTVEINLMTDTRLAIPFRFGKSFVVLKFRRAAYSRCKRQSSLVI